MGFHIYFVIYGILQVKADGTCRYYPKCKYGDACNYRHPTAAEVSLASSHLTYSTSSRVICSVADLDPCHLPGSGSRISVPDPAKNERADQ